MIARLLRIAVAVIVGVALLYLSRFWPFDLWSRPGLFGLRALPPGGDLVRLWLRGTPYAPFSLQIWVVLTFLVLSFTERVTSRKT
ncbi:hypothetical protein E2K80_10740 [Rhodophyticola sp. CCM32]|uniref:hypothetical protein n=1 Tax=Rhodophyticola sp. CCM32 TaxID=2916397 RepID=UPI00107F7A0F|nr:hypothetical protein [Rhodophyticola sp. CCM32]QBY01141.1 hypothetical protein E2K80_10740 [Rhodophyticola sp. CCM32]